MTTGNNETVARITTETVTKKFVDLIVNGKSIGKREINGGPSLFDFVSAVAKEQGIRTFTVQLDGAPVSNETAKAPVADGARVAVNAKDSRGADEAATEQADGAGEEAEAEVATEAAPADNDEEEEEEAAA